MVRHENNVFNVVLVINYFENFLLVRFLVRYR